MIDVDNRPANYTEFVLGRVGRTRDEYIAIHGHDVSDGWCDFIIDYGFGGHILYNDDSYYINVCANTYKTESLWHAENILWDQWAKSEIAKDIDIKDDLHQRAKMLLDEMDEVCSLDEVIPKEHPEFASKIDYILKQFRLL